MPKNVLSDVTIELTGFYSKQYYPEHLRLVRYWDKEQKREFVFLTNAMHISALLVAELYKNRWQVELFFKWLKQHLRIKKFWGTTENAVRIQIFLAICTDSLVAIVQKDMQLDRSTYLMHPFFPAKYAGNGKIYCILFLNPLRSYHSWHKTLSTFFSRKVPGSCETTTPKDNF